MQAGDQAVQGGEGETVRRELTLPQVQGVSSRMSKNRRQITDEEKRVKSFDLILVICIFVVYIL